MIYQFADLQLDLGKRHLLRGDKAIKLPKLSFELLKVLVETSPNFIQQNELIDKVWGEHAVVAPENLNQRITMLRKSLSDDATNPHYIKVIHGQGYSLIPSVEIIKDVDSEKSSLVRSQGLKSHSNRLNKNWLKILSLITLVILLFKLVQSFLPIESNTILPNTELKIAPTIAVLPFVNMSDNKENEHFSDGISEEVINVLVRQTNLSVVSRTLSFQFKGKRTGAKEIANILNATHLLEGSVRKFGDKLRITAQLIDLSSGAHLWSNQYDRSLENLFEVQTDISNDIVKEIKYQLESKGESRLQQIISNVEIKSRSNISADAYEAYLKGLLHRNKMLPDDMSLAIEYFEEATRLEPSFIEAWELLIESQLDATMVYFSVSTYADAYNRIEKWLEIVLPLYPENLYLRSVNGAMLAFNQYRWKEGIAEIEKVLPLIRNDPRTMGFIGASYVWLSYQKDALPLLQEAYQLNPYSPQTLGALSIIYWGSGDKQKAIEILDIEGMEYFTSLAKATLYSLSRDFEQYDENFRRAKKYLSSEHHVIKIFQLLLHSLKGEKEAVKSIKKSLIANMKVEPITLGWVRPTKSGWDEMYEIVEQQRQPVIGYWILEKIAKNRPLSQKLDYYRKKIKLGDLPKSPEGPFNHRSKEQRAEIIANELKIPMSLMEKYVGVYKNDKVKLYISIIDNRLHYRRLYRLGTLSSISPDQFQSVNYSGVEFEFLANEKGEYDLCVMRDGDLVWYGYKVQTSDVSSKSKVSYF